MATVSTEIQSLAPSALVELFILDAGKQGGPVLRFHAGTNALDADVVWQGQTYQRYPVEASGFAKRGSGTLPRPTLRASNIGGVLAATARAYADFVMCKVTRIRTFARFLDAVNFLGGTNPEADPTAELPREIWYVDRKAREDAQIIEFELAASIDVAGVRLPRRQFIQGTCTWVYRGEDCGYTGPAVAKADGTATADINQDRCGKSLSDCKLRFGTGVLPGSFFPGCGLIR